MRGKVTLRRPIERAMIQNWDDMENLWEHVFINELHTDSKQAKLLLTDPPLSSKQSREHMAQSMFETFVHNLIYQ